MKTKTCIKKLQKMIIELKVYYPIPNLFLGLDFEQSEIHRGKLIEELELEIKYLLKLDPLQIKSYDKKLFHILTSNHFNDK